MDTHHKTLFALCIDNGGYVDDLKVRTIYQVLPDESAAKSQYLRIIDETGEDYLYPAACFVLIDVPQEAEQAFAPQMAVPSAQSKRKRARHRTGSSRKILA